MTEGKTPEQLREERKARLEADIQKKTNKIQVGTDLPSGFTYPKGPNSPKLPSDRVRGR